MNSLTRPKLCPCGGTPEPDSDYCGYDCTPTHLGVHTKPLEFGTSLGWVAKPDPWEHLGRTVAQDTDPASVRLADWLRWHNIDPATVLSGAPIQVDGEGVTVTVPLLDEDGTVKLDPGDRRIVLTETRTYPLINVEHVR